MADGPVRITEQVLDVVEVLINAGPDEMHGWAITKAAGLASSTVYKVLDRLKVGGIVAARWEHEHPDGNKPRRRFYRLTGSGAAWAVAILRERRPDRASRAARPRLGWAVQW